MKLPSYVRVCGRRYDVKRASSAWLTEKFGDAEGFELEGICHHLGSAIWIAEELAEDRAWGTLEHEIAHAVAEETGARHCVMRGNLELEEKLIVSWLPQYLETIRNGMVFE